MELPCCHSGSDYFGASKVRAFCCPVDGRLGQIVPALGVGCPAKVGCRMGPITNSWYSSTAASSPRYPSLWPRLQHVIPCPWSSFTWKMPLPQHQHIPTVTSHTLAALCALLDSGKWLMSIFKNRSLEYISPTSNSRFSLF